MKHVKVIGFEALRASIKNVQAVVSPDVDHARAFAEEHVKRLRQHIERSDIPVAELAESTQERKGHDTPYIDSGKFLDKLSFELDRRTKVTTAYRSGALKSVVHHSQKGEKYTMYRIAKYLAYGTKTIPARDVFTPTAQEIVEESAKWAKRLNTQITVAWG